MWKLKKILHLVAYWFLIKFLQKKKKKDRDGIIKYAQQKTVYLFAINKNK